MKRLLLTAMLVAFLAGNGISGSPGEFWTEKPYNKWSEKEVRHLLSDSPWAKTVTLRHTILKQTRRDFGAVSSLPGEGEGVSDPEVDYTLYIRTARPVREALVRMAQIEQRYERLEGEQRKAFDAKWEQFLDTPQSDKVIVQVKYYANTAEVDRQLANYWQTQTVETLRDSAAMTGPDGLRVAPVAFWTARGAGREFQLAFPRPKSAIADSAISVEIRHPDVTGEAATRIYAKFPIKEMKYQGDTSY